MRRSEWEQGGNRLLRRADWRFLLSDPQPGVILCFAEGPIRDAVAHMSTSMANSTRNRSAACDLVVAVDPEPDTLREAFARLRPGGSCYTEWSGFSATDARARASLSNAGFSHVQVYWTWPSRERCQLWLPLNDPAIAARYFAREVLVAHGLARGLVRRTRHAIGRMRSRLGLTLQVSAIGTKPDPRCVREPDARDDEAPFLAGIRRGWSDWGLGPAPIRLSCLMQAAGSHSNNKVVMFVFADDHPDPRLVMKTARVPEAAVALAREAATLEAVQASPTSRLSGVPRLLRLDADRSLVTVCETALPGSAISASLARRRYAELARIATAWLIEFGEASRRPPSDDDWTSFTAARLEEFERNYGAATKPTLVQAVKEACSGCGPPGGAYEHRDFSPWNVLIDDRARLSVLDWESAELHGFVGLDLIYFLSLLAFYRDGLLGSRFARPSIAAFRASYRAAWESSTPTGSTNHACLSEYGRSLGIEPAAFPALRLVTWLSHTRSDLRLDARVASTAPGTQTLRHGLFLNLLEEESVSCT